MPESPAWANWCASTQTQDDGRGGKIAAMISFFINGEPAELLQAMTIGALLEARGLAGKRVAVERNGEIVPKSQHAAVAVESGDRIEIVVAVGGG
jgi:sulfur carrier protein